MDFQDLEAVEGLRFSWNAWPTTRLEASRCAVPFGLICHPVQVFSDLPELQYSPLACGACKAVLNPFCPVNFGRKTWSCCICAQVNDFPKSHSGISETNLPAELFPTHNVVEYCVPQAEQAQPPAVLFVIDTCGPMEDLWYTTHAVEKAVAALPEGVKVGLVSFATMVSVHVLRHEDVPQAVLLKGDNKALLEQLLVRFKKLFSSEAKPSETKQTHGPPNGEGAAPETITSAATAYDWTSNDILVSGPAGRKALVCALKALKPDNSPGSGRLRPKRVTGAALAAALAALEAAVPPGSPGRVVAFLSGPCTAGPGMVVEQDYSDELRSHHDLQTNQTLHFRAASAYYSSLGARMAASMFALDVFGVSPDQVGLAELRPAVEATGGTMLLVESPDMETFAGTFFKIFRQNEKGELDMCFDATVEVRSSEHVRIGGALGPCSAIKRGLGLGPCVWVSEASRVGQSGAWAWHMPSLAPSTALAVVFDIASVSAGDILPDSTFFIQMCTSYLDSGGARRLRVCTVGRRWKNLTPPVVPKSSGGILGLGGGAAAVGDDEEGRQEETAMSLLDVVTGFDQEAAAALVAKIAVAKMETQDPQEVVRWLDRMLVRFGARFGRYTPNMPPSFILSSNLFLFPSFVYHLRRSPFLQIFNCSPDDSAFRRLALLREGVPHSLLMVQPNLISYTLNTAPQYVPLDLAMVKPECILLYDSFFEIVVHHGSTIAQWKRAGYHKDGVHATFKRLLEEPIEAAKVLARERWLEPRLIVCEQSDSLSRYLTYRLSPATNEMPPGHMEHYNTDDASLQSFIGQFHNLAVKT